MNKYKANVYKVQHTLFCYTNKTTVNQLVSVGLDHSKFVNYERISFGREIEHIQSILTQLNQKTLNRLEKKR